MIQDIYPHKLTNAWVPGRKAEPDGLAFRFSERGVCLRMGETVDVPRVRDFSPNTALTYLFLLDKAPCFLADEQPLGDGWAEEPLRSLRGRRAEPREMVFAAWTAWQLYNWYRDNVYCGRCGGRTEPAEDERAIVCPACKRRIYPRIIPAVIVGVTNGNKLLTTKYSGRGFSQWALVAGFTEIGETLEETVAREVLEETGLRVKNIRYYASQPWGIVDDLLAGFYCDVDGDDTIHMDSSELKEAVWTERENIVLQEDDFSLTNEMMLRFRQNREPKA